MKFRRQFPIAGFIADFACVEVKLVVELDGGQHVERTVEDADRTARIEGNGYRVLHFWNDDVLLRTDDVLEVIWREAASRKATPLQLSPASRGEGKSTGETP